MRIVKDIWTSPTYTRDAAQALERLIRDQSTGIFHIANKGGCSWLEFAEKAIELVGLSCKIDAVPASEYPMKARPASRLKVEERAPQRDDGGTLRSWHEALRAYLTEKGYLASSR